MKPVQARRGHVLTLFAVLLVVLLPLAALVVDMGLVLLARRQMQTAVNTAALEGQWHRDSMPLSMMRAVVDCPSCTTDDEFYDHVRAADPDCNCPSASDQVVHDYLRRRAAGLMIRATYDDDLLATSDDPLQFGAGPNVDYVGGTEIDGPGSFRAGPLIQIEESPVYQPVPVTNHAANDRRGDFVSGEFVRMATDHSESSPDYVRADFNPADVADAPAGGAFLARLRRSQENLDAQVGTTGPPVPFFFGRGGNTAAIGPNPQAVWNRREQGTQLRATAIADRWGAAVVGVPNNGLALLGVSHLWIDGDAGRVGTDPSWWERQSPGTVTVDTVTDPGRLIVQVDLDGNSVLEPPGVVPPNVEADFVRFAPVYRTIGLVPRVVGFANIQFADSTTLRKLPATIAPQNVSPRWRWMPEGMSADDLVSLRAAMASFSADPQNGPVLAARLVRSLQ
jgi:hypothetical protein